jgi:hypothetical protein
MLFLCVSTCRVVSSSHAISLLLLPPPLQPCSIMLSTHVAKTNFSNLHCSVGRRPAAAAAAAAMLDHAMHHCSQDQVLIAHSPCCCCCCCTSFPCHHIMQPRLSSPSHANRAAADALFKHAIETCSQDQLSHLTLHPCCCCCRRRCIAQPCNLRLQPTPSSSSHATFLLLLLPLPHCFHPLSQDQLPHLTLHPWRA